MRANLGKNRGWAMMSANPPAKHDYIPQFLLARWTMNDGELWRVLRPILGKIVSKLAAPAEDTGLLGLKPFSAKAGGFAPRTDDKHGRVIEFTRLIFSNRQKSA